MQLLEPSPMTNISAGEQERMKTRYDHFRLLATEVRVPLEAAKCRFAGLKRNHAVSMRLVPVIDEEFLGVLASLAVPPSL